LRGASRVNPHDDDIISGGISRLKINYTNNNNSPARVQKKIDVVYDFVKKDPA